MTPEHVVFGTGPAARALLRVLAEDGQWIRAVNRSGRATLPAGVELHSGDASDRDVARRAVGSARVVYHLAAPAYHRWAEELPPLQRAIVAAARDAGARLIVLENLYGYGRPEGPLTEQHPERPDTRKGRLRADLSRELRATPGLDLAIARASDYFGPDAGAQAHIGDRLLRAVLRGRPASFVGDLDQPHSFTYLPDIGRTLAVLGTSAQATGGVWHVPSGSPVTPRQLIEDLFAAAGRPPRVRRVPRPLLRLAALRNPDVREVLEMLPDFDEPFTIDSRKALQLGLEPTPRHTAVQETVHWYAQNPATPRH